MIPEDQTVAGMNRIKFEFVAGDEALNRNDEFLYTLFVPSRARLAFPCFDQPDLKARYTLTLRVPDGWQAVDIGPLTIALFKSEIARAKTILWNGPPGIFEIQEFSAGTEAIAEALAESNATTIIGGGDSVTAARQAGLAEKMTFISTGGGASLELIEGKELPGVAALTEK